MSYLISRIYTLGNSFQALCREGLHSRLFFFLSMVATTFGVTGCGDVTADDDILVLGGNAADCRQSNAACTETETCIMNAQGLYQCVATSTISESMMPAENDTVAPMAFVQATVQVADPLVGQPMSGVEVSYQGNVMTTGPTGSVSLQVATGAYSIALNAPGYATHRLQGVAGLSDFTQITFMGNEAITNQTLQSLGLTRDPDKGFLVVGLDRPNLSPAVGASASLDIAHDSAFILSGFSPSAGSVIPQGGQSFVSFPNTGLGMVTVSATNTSAANPCFLFPAGVPGTPATVDLRAGEIAVIAFTCPQ